MPAEIVLVAAVSDNGVIGRDGGMPWHLPRDLKRFKSMTVGHPVVMGRRTWDSLGRPLPDRHNIVVSRSPDVDAPGVTVVNGPDAAVEAAAKATSIMIIGGGQIYRWFLEQAHRVELTRVHTEVEGDVSFPTLDNTWTRTHADRFDADKANRWPMTFETWTRQTD